MVKIYDIEDYRTRTALETKSDTARRKSAEIILFMGVRYERLAAPSHQAYNQVRHFQASHHTRILRPNCSLDLKSI